MMHQPRRSRFLCAVMVGIGCLFLAACEMFEDKTEENALRASLVRNPNDTESRAELASLLSHKGEHEEAARILAEGARQSPDDAAMRRQLARTYTFWGRETNENRHLSTALAHWKRLIDMGAAGADDYYQLGLVLDATGLRQLAVDAYSMAAALQPENLSYRAGIAWAYKETGKYEMALPLLQRLVEQYPDNHQYHWWLSDNYRMLGDYEEALVHMRKAYETSPRKARAETREDMAYTQLLMEKRTGWSTFHSHYGLALRHRENGRPDREAAEYKAATDACPDSPDAYAMLGWCYLHLALFQSHVENYEQAVEYAKQAVEAYTKSDNKKDMAFGYETLGNNYTRLAETTQNREFYESALRAHERQYECAQEANHILQVIYATAARANTLRNLYGLEDERTREWRANVNFFLPKPGEQINEARGIAAYTEGIFRLTEEDDQGAKELFEMVFDFYCRTLDIRSAKAGPHILNMLTSIALREEDYDTAIAYGERAVERLMAIRALLGADEFRRKVGGAIWHATFAENLVRCALAKFDPVAAFNYSEQYKGRTLLDLLGGQAINSRRAVLHEKRREELTLMARVESIEQRIDEAKATNEHSSLRSLERTLSIEMTNYERLRQDVTVAEREITLFEQVEPLSLAELHELAGKHDFTFVTYVAGHWGTAATVVTKDTVHALALENATQAALGDAMLACLPGLGLDMAESLRDLTIELDTEIFRPDAEAAAQEALDENLNLLYTLLIEPVLPYVNTRLVYISPDAFLNRLPFEALHRDGTYLAEQFAIAYTPSASVLKTCLDKGRHRRDSVLALGNPNLMNPAFRLIHAENEVNALEGLFAEAKILTFDAATETAVKQFAHDFDVLHFACHGELNYDDPMLTSLRLAPDDHNDGYLHAAEVFGLDLHASLVVLSACNSGLGEVTTGNELMGLTRGFLAAGAPAIIATLWTVDDRSTAFLMEHFYQNLASMTTAEALQKARLATKKEYPNPFHWAPFVLVGDAR